MGEIKTKSVYYDPVDKTEGGDGQITLSLTTFTFLSSILNQLQ
jgi:hypothetical protein